MSQYLLENDGASDDLAALDFDGGDVSPDDGFAESDALDFSVAENDGGENAALEGVDEYAPAESEDTGTESDALDSQNEDAEANEEDEDSPIQLFTAANPSDAVLVSALIDGRTQRVDLSQQVTSMSESELAEEILVLADLARQKGLAGQHTFLLEDASLSETLREMGFDGNEVVRDFAENGTGLPTPKPAAEAQATVFANRYATD
jgi:hypothetical protein